MLTKYNLIHVPSGGVDHLLDGVRVRIDNQLTDAQAEQLKACGLPYFQEIESSLPSPNHGQEKTIPASGSDATSNSRPGATKPKRNARGKSNQ